MFVGLKSGKEHSFGMMVYLGRSISIGDITSKLEDNENLTGSHGSDTEILDWYLNGLQQLKIGNIVQLSLTEDGFSLELVAKTPSAAARDLNLD